MVAPRTVSWLRVALAAAPPRATKLLLQALGGPEALLAEDPARIESLAGPAAARAFRQGCDPRLLERTLSWLEVQDHHAIALDDPRYPPPLIEIEDPPAVLYAAGRAELLRQPCLAIVGSRNSGAQGREDARAFAHALSQAGLVIASGLALGIDAAAHRGGLAGPASSIAVMGTGPEGCYPRAHRALAAAIACDGCLVSEFPLGTPPLPGNFPRRNRLITGISLGVLVVEAGLPSGSLTTARHALEQGREVFAMPGSIHSPLSRGCHWLIKQGAKLVESAADVLEELRWSVPAPASGPECVPCGEDDSLLQAMGHGPVTLDQLAQRSGLAMGDVAARITTLEIEGLIAPLPGGIYQRVTRAPQPVSGPPQGAI